MTGTNPRTLAVLAAALLAGGCETAFVGRAPAGIYQLVAVNGRALPFVIDPAVHCPVRIDGGRFELDALARRFELAVDRSGPCAGLAADVRERGSYLRRGGVLTLETEGGAGPPHTLVATESGNAITLEQDGLRLRFRQTAPR